MSVIAKFRIHEIVARPRGGGQTYDTVNMSAITPQEVDGLPGESEENVRFHAATPVGTISLSVSNPDALEQFQPGDEFYVRFEKVPAPE